MKKSIAMLLTLALAASSLAACGKSQPAATQAPAADTTAALQRPQLPQKAERPRPPRRVKMLLQIWAILL